MLILQEEKDLTGMLYHNDIRRHASLENVPPAQFLKNHGLKSR